MLDKEKSGLREEDNIEKDDFQEGNQDSLQNDVYDGLSDFVEYDDLANLEGLPQLDELDKMDDLSAVPEVSASIKMDDSNNTDIDTDDMDIPLPDVGITDEDGIASELSDGSDIKTTFPQMEADDDTDQDEIEQLAEPEPVVDNGEMENDIDTFTDEEVSEPEQESENLDDIMSMLDEESETAEVGNAQSGEEPAPIDDIMAMDEATDDSMPESDEQDDSLNDIMSILEDESGSTDDAMPVSEEEQTATDDIMSMLEDGAGEEGQETENENLDDMLGGLLDNLDENGSIDEGEQDSESVPESETQEDDIEDLLGMLSDDSNSEDIMSLDSGAEDEIPDINDLPDISADESGMGGDIADILPTEEKSEEDAEQPGFFKKVFGNVVNDEIAEAEKQAREDEAAKLEEAEKLKEEKAIEKAQKKEEKAKLKAEKAEEKAAKKAKKAEEKAAKKAEKLAKKEEEAAAAAQEVVGKLNKVGVAIVAIFGIIFLAGTLFLTNTFGSGLDKKEAKNYYDMSKYSKAYEAAVGTNMKKKDPEQYQKIVIAMKVQHSLDAYQNYENVKKYPEALDALLMGLKKYDANKKAAYDLEMEDKLEGIYEKILDILSDEFNLSKSQAYDILSLNGSDYTKKVTDIANK